MSPTTSPSAMQPIDCETAVRRLWDYLDGRLGAVPREEVEAHLAWCEMCPPHFAFGREIQAALAASTARRDDGADDAEAALRARVRDALRRQLPDDDGSPTT